MQTNTIPKAGLSYLKLCLSNVFNVCVCVCVVGVLICTVCQSVYASSFWLLNFSASQTGLWCVGNPFDWEHLQLLKQGRSGQINTLSFILMAWRRGRISWRGVQKDCVSLYVCLYICDWQAGQRYTSYILSVNFYCWWELGWLKALRCVFHMCVLQKELYRSQRPEDAPRSPDFSIERLVYLPLWTDLPYEIPKSWTVLYCFPPYFHLHKERSVGWFIWGTVWGN